MSLGQRGSHVVRRPDGASHGERVHQEEGDVHVRHPRLGWSRVVVECHCSGARTRWSVPCRRGEVKTQSTTAWFGTDRVENRGVTKIELAATSIGRAVQARIYREGAFGRLPTVPVSPAALERAARRRMSRAAYAYVAGAAGQERTARANPDAFGRWSDRAAHAARHHGARHVGRAVRPPAAGTAAARADRRPGDGAPRCRPRGRRGGVVARPADGVLDPGVPVDGGLRRGDGGSPRWFQLYWSSSDDLVASFLSAGRGGPAARPSSSRSTRTCSAGGRATSTSATCRSRTDEGSRSTPATRCSGGWCSSGSRTPAPDRDPGRGRRPDAVRTLVSTSAAAYPGRLRRQPALAATRGPPSRRSSTCSPGPR